MTPVPLDLPVRPSEAAALARVVFETAGQKPLTGELRARMASRASALELQTIRPWFGSLACDPVRRAGFYLAVDGIESAPLLLHLAPSTAPTGTVFPRALLIGRAGDVVVNAVPFGPEDRDALDAFAARVDPAFQPRPQAARSAIVAAPTAAAFEAFRKVLTRTGKNLAATEGPYHRSLWCAIRAGWREGWSAGIELDPADPLPGVRECPLYTRFTLACADPAEAAVVRARIAGLRSAVKAGRPFDFELSFESASEPTTPEDIERALACVRAEWIAPRLDDGSDVEALAAAALRCRSQLSIRAPRPPAAARLTYKVIADTGLIESAAALLA